jgi:hypothetical protein
MLKRHLNYTNSEIDDLAVRTGVEYLTNLYDEKMEKKVTELYLHGYNPKDASQCGTQYKMWMNRKNGELEPEPELTMDPKDIEKLNKRLQREIDRAVGKRMLK